MIGAARSPLGVQRSLIIGSLLAVTVASWVETVQQAGMPAGMGGVASMTPAVFLAGWTVMMAAMMFPAAAPVILAFAAVHAEKRRRGVTFVSTWVFSSGYLVVWTLFGALAYAATALVAGTVGQSLWVQDNGGRLVGILLVLAGGYQLSPLKHACLGRCRSPLAFFATSWRSGRAGALRMGIEHGLSCLGCCWLLYAMLFPLGVMNLTITAVLSLLVFAEKTLPGGDRTARIAGVALAGAGLAFGFGAAVPMWL